MIVNSRRMTTTNGKLFVGESQPIGNGEVQGSRGELVSGLAHLPNPQRRSMIGPRWRKRREAFSCRTWSGARDCLNTCSRSLSFTTQEVRGIRRPVGVLFISIDQIPSGYLLRQHETSKVTGALKINMEPPLPSATSKWHKDDTYASISPSRPS